MCGRTVHIFVDSLSSTSARILTDGDDPAAFTMPRRLLPEHVREGEWLAVTMRVDAARASEEKSAIDDLYREIGES